MTVKELIMELLNCDMDAEVKFNDYFVKEAIRDEFIFEDIDGEIMYKFECDVLNIYDRGGFVILSEVEEE